MTNVVQIVEHVEASPAAFCSSKDTSSPSLSFNASLKPFVAASRASCCTSWQIPTDENPDDEGYHVKHADGHESWSPKEDFENTFFEKGKNLLNDTALLMSSEDYKERFIAEYQQLVIRYKRLKKMLDAWDKGELKFAPTCPRNAYNMQIKAMADYIAVLESRAFIEGIKIFAEQKASD